MIDDTFYNEITRQPLRTPRYNTVYRHCGRDWQDAETIFFVHGSLTSGRWFEPLMAAFEELMPGKYASYAPDLRSHGEADPLPFDDLQNLAADMLAVLDVLGIRQAHLVGWSLGGSVATLLALDHPERCLSLSLLSSVGPTSLPELPPAQQHSLSEAIRVGHLENLRRIMRLNNFREGRFPANNTPPGNALLSYLTQTALQTQNYSADSAGGEGSNLAIPKSRVAERLQQAQFKTLGLHGDADPLVPNEYFARMKETWPPLLFEEVIFEDSSHAPHVEQPRRAAIELDYFFNRL